MDTQNELDVPTTAELLRELDRPVRVVDYARWRRPVKFRAMQATDFAIIADEFDDPQGLQAIEFSARVLAATVIDPVLTEREWLGMCHGTVVDLGEIALEVNGLTDAVQKKT